MEIIELHELPKDSLEFFLNELDGEKSIFSKLASSQTGNDRTVTRERIEYVLGSHDHIMLVCIEEAKLIGMTLGQRVTGINNSYMYIHDVVVNPDIRGGGVGSKLVTALMNAGKEKWPEIVRIQLTSRPSRGAAGFFQKLGFRPRTKESEDETVVYVIDLDEYSS